MERPELVELMGTLQADLTPMAREVWDALELWVRTLRLDEDRQGMAAGVLQTIYKLDLRSNDKVILTVLVRMLLGLDVSEKVHSEWGVG